MAKAKFDGCRCGECGYDLSGLSRVGACPECGQAFNTITGQGLVREANAEERADKLSSRMRTVSIAVVALMVLVCAGLLVPLFGQYWRIPVAVAVLLGLIGGFAAVISYIREKQQ